MESKYKVGQVVIIAEDLEAFEECEHRHLTDTMKEAYNDLALIVDVKPAEGLLTSKDDGFNYYLKIFRDRSYTRECEAEYWTSELFEECATPKFKIGDIVHFTDPTQYEPDAIYKVKSYYKDSDDHGDLAVGYQLIRVHNPDYDHYVDAREACWMELVQTERVDVTQPSGALCVKSDADIISNYNSNDVEFLKQQIINLQQKLQDNENRLRKQEESITGSGRPGELGILNPGNQARSRNPKACLTEVSFNSRKGIGFFED